MDLISLMVRPLCDIASLGQLASGVPFRPWITFHMFGPSELDIASWRRSFQLSVLASLIDSVDSRQASIHSWRFWCIIRQRRCRVRILTRTCGVIQGLDFLLDLDFSTWVVAAEKRMSLKRETQRDRLGSSGRLCIFDSTSLVKQGQSTLFWPHQRMAGHLAPRSTPGFCCFNTWLHLSTLQNFARGHFVYVIEVSIVFSWEIDIKTGESIWKGLITKVL